MHGRLAVLDELRGLAITLLILFHAGGVLVWNNYLHGDLGTCMFLGLSGLGLAYGAAHEPPRTFFRRRLLRIMPTYWIVLTAYIVCNQHFLQHDYSALNIIAHYLGVHGFLGDAIGLAINDSFWFVTAFLVCYACFFALKPLLDRPEWLLVWAGALSTGVSFLLFFTGQAGLMGHFGFRFGSFFAGMLIGHAMRSGGLRLRLGVPLVAALLLFGYVPYTRGITFISTFVSLSVVFGYCLWLRARLPAQVGKPVKAVLGFLGAHSLEIAILHLPLMRDYNYYLQGRWFNVARPGAAMLILGMLAGLAVTLVLSVELRRLTKRMLGRENVAVESNPVALVTVVAGRPATIAGKAKLEDAGERA
ncbi:MAG: acyltransferase family protein [Verrucomicrobiota bacterium]